MCLHGRPPAGRGEGQERFEEHDGNGVVEETLAEHHGGQGSVRPLTQPTHQLVGHDMGVLFTPSHDEAALNRPCFKPFTTNERRVFPLVKP